MKQVTLTKTFVMIASAFALPFLLFKRIRENRERNIRYDIVDYLAEDEPLS